MKNTCCHHAPLAPVSPERFTVEGVLDFLKKLGFRQTLGRRSIVEVLFAAEKPLAIEEIRTLAWQKGKPKLDYATVFRLIERLLALNILAKVNMQSSCSYFELRNPDKHYDHLICRLCRKVHILDFPCPVSTTEQLLTEKYGFKKLTHSLEFFGVCPDCSAAT